MIRNIIARFSHVKWGLPADVKNFVWSPDSVSAFSNHSRHKNAHPDDLPLLWLFQGTMLGNDLWESIDHWWNRFPAHFGMFWTIVQQQPRQKWSLSALRTLAKHVPVDEVENLVASALLCDDGRAWLLASTEYSFYLSNISDEQIQQWVRSTTYSMSSLFEAFESLAKLQRHMQPQHCARIANALANHFNEQEAAVVTNNVAKAWHMSTSDLDKWMEDDKQLPFWFDPVNKISWIEQCAVWTKETGYAIDNKSPLYTIVRG